MNLRDYMAVINYKVTEGSEFLWKCFGDKAYRLDSWSGVWNNADEGYTISVVFDTETQVVYEVEAWDYNNERAYRWCNPDYIKARNKEYKKRNIDIAEAWDHVKFVELEVEADFLEKARAIVAGEEYDTRVQIEVEFDDETMLAAMKLAHEQDITFNQLVEQTLAEALADLEKTKEKNNG